jgi:hypothetical protein
MTLKKAAKSYRLVRLVHRVFEIQMIRAFMEAAYITVKHLEILSSKNSLTNQIPFTSFSSHHLYSIYQQFCMYAADSFELCPPSLQMYL